jgi:hypothetical protein
MKRAVLFLAVWTIAALAMCSCASADIIPVGAVDYQYHGDLNGTAWTWTPIIDPGYGAPDWFTIPFSPDKWLSVPNHEQLDKVKHFWLEVEWQSDPRVVPASPTVWAPQGFTVAGGTNPIHLSNNAYVWEWIITPQPGAEILQFPNVSFPWAGVIGLDVASMCVPEPSTVSLLGIVAISLIALGRRHRRKAA